jgi:hypothetical protein
MRRPWAVTVLLLFALGAGRAAWAQTEDPGQPNWAKYHSTADAYALLDGWAKAYPNLTNLYPIGQTLKGTPLQVLEITNKQTGPARDKPGYYYDGNIHAGELTGGEVALHFAWYLLSNYGKDPRVTRLVDSHVLYIRPKFNPDGADLALLKGEMLRSTPRPYDEDFDGLLDEDPPNDLNGDGAITQMRVPDPNGLWKANGADPRRMIRRQAGDSAGPFYSLYSEGVDDDGDGRFNEDGVGGIDMNRNFPRNWGLEIEQEGAGPYPLSEPETQATIAFLTAHRNVAGIVHGHTAGGFLYRLPSSEPWDSYGLEDQRLILELGQKYHEVTNQPVIPSFDNPKEHRHGTLISWAYWDYGVVGWVPEFWGGFGKDDDGNGSVSEAERFRFNDEVLGGAGFAAWTAFDHPQLGKVEIGGWRSRFTTQNPPTQLLQRELEKYLPWLLWLAEIGPRLVLEDATATPLGASGLYRVRATVANAGFLPTNITQRAVEARLIQPVFATVQVRDAELISGAARQALGHLPGRRDLGSEGTGQTRRTLEYVVRRTGQRPVVTLVVESEKGGVVRREIALK